MAKRITKAERELKEFRKWLGIQIAGRLDDGSLIQSGVVSYTRGAHKVYKKKSI